MNELSSPHHTYMQEALHLARTAFDNDEVPIGALIVDAQGIIIGKGSNEVERRSSQVAHAEMVAIEQAGAYRKDWRLEGCWLYVTLEPCAMCMQLVLLSRLTGVVYGAESPVFGFHLDNTLSLQLYKKMTLEIVKGVGKKESEELLKQFFQSKRKKG